MPEDPRFFITTPIYYVNARPHLGHAYTTLAADAIARRKRAMGIETWFLTGTDEHGQKIERSAKLAGQKPLEFADRVSGQFRALWDRMGLTYDDFIRTTEPRHRQGVQRLFETIQRRGFIYKGSYTGQYCVSDELYVDAPAGSPCPDCGRITETVSEENYFFKLSAFERPLLQLYEDQPGFIRPEARRNEVVSFVRGGLKDLSISRTSFNWGIPAPGDARHVVYVWMDALANYITALGYGSDKEEDRLRFERFWPCDLHVIGKEISRFHCVYWPAFLMAAGLPLPKAIVAHGWLLFDQSKMSKSRGNIVRAETVVDALGADALRYYLLREVVFGQDGGFSFAGLIERYNADLANGYGNLTSRTLSMIARYCGGAIPEGRSEPRIRQQAATAAAAFSASFDALDFSRALEALWSFVAAVDGYITEMAPWKLAATEDSKEALAGVLYTCAESLRIVTALVYPVLPVSAARIWAQLGLGDIANADLKDPSWGGLMPGTRLGPLGPVFPRAEKELVERMQEVEKNNAAEAEESKAGANAEAGPETKSDSKSESGPENRPKNRPAAPVVLPAASPGAAEAHAGGSASVNLAGRAPANAPPAKPQPSAASNSASHPASPAASGEGRITIDDFAKVDLRVAQVRVAERVPGADRLLRLEVSLGEETRQIVAGIAEAYEPASLVGRKVVIVANLQPRKLRGLESNGMIVAASVGEKGRPVLAGFLEEVEAGARLK